jgi:hypothetical protein
MRLMHNKVVARWESLNGRHWIEVEANKNGYSYNTDGVSFGYIGYVHEDLAISRVASKLSEIYPEAMERVI